MFTPRSLRLSRRTLLRGASVAIALPWLEAMGVSRAPLASADVVRPPVRLLYYFVPNGIHMPAWRPETEGSDFAMPATLAPLEPYRDQVLVLSGIANRAAIDSIAGDHARGTAAFLTAQRAERSEERLSLGISADQVAANALGRETRWPSLQLGLESGASAGVCDSGYSCAYSNNISWADADTPLPKLTSPYVAFERLFGGDTGELDEAAAARRRQYRQSVLDSVVEQARDLEGQLGASDRAKLDEYLTAVREVEVRLAAAPEVAGCGTVELPPGLTQDPTAHAQAMNELLVLALRCDLTRVASFMLGNGGSLRVFPFLDGVVGFHHEISHHQHREANLLALQKINLWELQQVADLVGRLRAAEDVDGTSLLDNTLLYLSSEISDGDAHNHTDLPTLLIGGGGGAVRSGRHVAYAEERSAASLFVSMFQAAGVGVDAFGIDGDGPLDGLT
ncbi:MAG: DUF1552 domain-containing protein [Myxococcales bacterium]|nr:DUF1552 domain-containing protein [Myxococcales bacterium]